MLRRREHGTPGQLALPIHDRGHERPSVQLPARIDGSARVIGDFGEKARLGAEGLGRAAAPALAVCCSRSASLTARSTPSRIWRAAAGLGVGGSCASVERFQQPFEIVCQQLLAERRIAARARQVVLGDQVTHEHAPFDILPEP